MSSTVAERVLDTLVFGEFNAELLMAIKAQPLLNDQLVEALHESGSEIKATEDSTQEDVEFFLNKLSTLISVLENLKEV